MSLRLPATVAVLAAALVVAAFSPSPSASLVAQTGRPDVGSPAPLLDPPARVRTEWLTRTLAKHAFVVLVFYRGFW